ncbi:MAG: hypothetical protein H7247_15680 [Polaromonas sp.]|nr:hypothetical protein [Gemmatimonadaceae bacterium]
MATHHRAVLLVIVLLGRATTGAAQVAVPAPAPQNPSPMVEHSRAHERVAVRALDGARRTFIGPLAKPVELFIPASTNHADVLHLVVHFHGGAFIPEYAVSQLAGDHVVAVVNLAPGSGVYDRAFSDPAAFDSLLANITRETSVVLNRAATFTDVTLVGFSAGHGAVRAILRDSAHFDRVNAVLLLDGLHTSYVPDNTVMEKGGTLDEGNLAVFVRFARAAIRGEKRFLVTHSEIFPGSFASTTETTDYLGQVLGLRRTSVLRWGPRGMQQLSEVKMGRFEILGFAGNAGPDHIDHLQAMPEFLGKVQGM